MVRFVPVPLRSWLRCSALALGVVTLGATLAGAQGAEPSSSGRDSRHRFRTQMPATVRADHPYTAPVAEAIRRVTRDPLEQLVVVERVTKLLVEYDSDQRVYQRRDYHATLDEMIDRAQAERWDYLRDDCDGRAVFAAHLLAALQIPWRLETSYWKGHAWVSVHVQGRRYDLLDLRAADPELRRASYRLLGRAFTRRSTPPPPFAWRQAWLERTAGDLEVGQRLGLLERGGAVGQPVARYAVNWTTPAVSAAAADRTPGALSGAPGGD